jgi:hypothetical protein
VGAAGARGRQAEADGAERERASTVAYLIRRDASFSAITSEPGNSERACRWCFSTSGVNSVARFPVDSDVVILTEGCLASVLREHPCSSSK